MQACQNHLPSGWVMIGDSYELDIKVPRSLGMKTIYVISKNNNLNHIDSVVVSSVLEIQGELIRKLENKI